MKFLWKILIRRLQGTDNEAIQIALIHELTKKARQNHAIFAICLQISVLGQHNKTIHLDMKEILHEFSEILRDLTGLPPIREVDH